jgi:tetratricopeptide (TPR) repeat protein
MTLQALTACCRDDVFLLHRHILPHIVDMLDQLQGQDIHINDLMAAGKILERQGHYQVAAELFKAALEKMRKSSGNHEINVAKICGWLAQVYWRQGRWNEAEKLGLEVLEQRRRVLGMEHPDTILAALNLAATHSKQHRHEEATALAAPAVQLSLKILGRQHPHTQIYLRHLVGFYDALGNQREAQETRHLLISPATGSPPG